MTNQDLERKVKRQLLGGSLSIQGSLDQLKDYPEDLKQGILNYYAGMGIARRLLRKYFGFGKSLTVKPDPKLLKAISQYD